jgi:sulfoxide reductase catalytic subunit YedY
MFIHKRRAWDNSTSGCVTPETAYLNRREFVAAIGLGTIGGVASRVVAGKCPPAELIDRHGTGRAMSGEHAVEGAGPYVEFGAERESARERARYATPPSVIEIAGLVRRPGVAQLDDLLGRFPLEERVYRFRCVEGWAMVVPWLGIPMRALVEWCRPTSSAKYVRFVAARDERQMPGIAEQPWYRWPYAEALTMAEATSELTFLATGTYGHRLSGDHGAPLRLVVPWKYGHKSIKGIARIEFVAERPATFWNSALPFEYSFEANVDPRVPHPRWSQRCEVMVGTGERVNTQMYNGYGPYVSRLYC